ncbi:MAG: hypothetical protein M0R40_09740 [Firmicutes bacterium]|nr:hypothetical protein [Bacillota bacterium]
MLLDRLRGNVNHAEGNGGNAAIVTNGSPAGNFRLGPGAYQPPFKAQIQMTHRKLYFTENAGVYTPVAAGAIDATLQTSLPVFFFLNSDFAAGYPTLQSNFPVSIWQYGDPVVVGRDQGRDAFGDWDANVTAQLRKGDIVVPFTASPGGTNTLALVIVRSADVPYASLLDSTNSNLFKVNMIRYTLADATTAQLQQFENPINIANQTMFGKFSKDTVNPDSYVNPEQNQPQIADILVVAEINKEKGIATYVNFDVVNFRWNLFIENVFRL